MRLVQRWGRYVVVQRTPAGKAEVVSWHLTRAAAERRYAVQVRAVSRLHAPRVSVEPTDRAPARAVSAAVVRSVAILRRTTISEICRFTALSPVRVQRALYDLELQRRVTAYPRVPGPGETRQWRLRTFLDDLPG